LAEDRDSLARAFTLRSSSVERVDAPQNREEIDEQGCFALASQFRARAGVSLLVVNKFQGAELGGQAAETLGVCIVKVLGHQPQNRQGSGADNAAVDSRAGG
jgi:hypothetical protein